VTPSPLLVDLYELTMGEAYLEHGLADRPATFQLFCRHLPPGWGYLVAAGLDDALGYLEELRFGPAELDELAAMELFGGAFLERLSELRFTGGVRAMPEGTIVFPDEPLLEVTAPVLEAQLVESVLLNELHLQTLIASKASRCVEAGDGRLLVDFALRRTHGGEAAVKVARASWLAGFDATSNVLASRRFGIPAAGTMAHSFVECFDDESSAFAAFLETYPQGSTLLIDTYDTVDGARLAADAAHTLRERGGRLGAVRLDSGDLLELSRRVRGVLDDAGLADVTIFASGNLDERAIERLVADGAPIDGFGVGSRVGVSADAPFVDVVYKLADFDGRPVLKLSAAKATLPAAKQVWRRRDGDRFAGDMIALADEPGPPGATPLLELVMRDGVRVARDTPAAARERAAEGRRALPEAQRRLDAEPYPVELSPRLAGLRDALTRERGSR
jgi:nicotinate phosphoribosyltransferase